MRVERPSVFAVTSIHDRHGRRVAQYLVDKAQDSLNREEQQPQKDAAPEEAVILARQSESPENDAATPGGEQQAAAGNLLHITA
jgi:hypothetical protein